MKNAHHQIASENNMPDVLDHLAESLSGGWKRYCKRLKRCQKSFSEEAVHDSRVETRRLISTVDLLAAFFPKRDVERVRCTLKEHLDTFDQLRDTQVQLVYVDQIKDAFTVARRFRDWLHKREAKLTRQTRKNIKAIKTKRLKRCLESFEKEIGRQHKETTPARAFGMVKLEMSRAFDRVAGLCRRVKAEDTETIHRTRVAFKRFRYMVEALSPLLRAVTDQHRHAMRGYQSMMGDIQDVEVLLETFDKFVRKEKIEIVDAKKLRNELARRRQLLIRVYLNAADKLQQFWPPPGLAMAAEEMNLDRRKP